MLYIWVLDMSFFPPCANTVPGYLFVSLPKTLKAWTNSHCKQIKWFFHCSESSAAGLARVCELRSACFHFHIQNFPGRILSLTECDGLHFNLWYQDLDGLILLKKFWMQIFNLCKWWFRSDCLFPLLYSKLSWAQLYIYILNWWFDHLAHWWYQSTDYKLSFRDSPSLPVEKSGTGFLTKMKGT